MGPAGPGPLVTLRRGTLELVVAPAAGGSVVSFRTETAGGPLDLLRPTPAWAAARGDPWAMAAFPLVPWSNRIRDARFAFDGREVSLAHIGAPARHALHGFGVRAAWEVQDAGPDTLALAHRPPAGLWPWSYRATQRLALEPAGLSVELELVNESPQAMPAGLGWHPYFPRTADTSLSAAVTGMWTTDREILPVDLVPLAPPGDPRTGLAVDRVALDNVFVDWDGRATITWPPRGARLVMTAPPPLTCLVVFTPPGQPYFCAEPVSHVTDAFNLHAAGQAGTGMRVLAPGEALLGAVSLAVELTEEPP